MRTIVTLIVFIFITAAYGQWESEDNELANLTRAEKKEFLGAEEVSQGRYLLPMDDGNDEGLPRFHDWRNYKGENYLTPVRAQGKCGSCVVFAAVGAFEAQINIANEWADLDLDLSEQEMLSCSGGSCSGWLPGYGVQHIMSIGMISEPYFPYLSGTIATDLACQEFPEANRIKAHGYTFIGHKAHMDYNHGIFEVIPVTKRQVIEALLKGPLATSMVVWEDLLSYKSGVYKHSSGEKLGGHAVVIVGYSLDENYWIIRNSWGDEWGEAGYFRIAMDDEDSGVANYNYRIKVLPFDKGGVAIIGHEERKILSSFDRVKVETSFKHAIRTVIRVKKDGEVKAVIPTIRKNWLFAFANREKRDIFKTLTNWNRLEEGLYQLQAATIFYDKGLKTTLSEPVEMMIVKKDPKVEIKIAGLFQDDKPLDLSAPVTGRINIEMDLRFSKIPPQRIELVIKHENGEKIIIKNNKPARKIYLGWRTTLEENGRYSIYARVITGEFSSQSQSFEIIVNNQ